MAQNQTTSTVAEALVQNAANARTTSTAAETLLATSAVPRTTSTVLEVLCSLTVSGGWVSVVGGGG